MNKIFALGLPLGLVFTGSAMVVAAPAQAATHAKGSLFVHGTTHQASFPSSAICQGYAKGSYDLLVRSAKLATPVGSGSGGEGEQDRFKCYPVRDGRWSYATAYISKTGSPLRSTDLYVDPARRRNGDPTVDTEAVWSYTHHIRNTVSLAQCIKNKKSIVNAVRHSPRARLIFASSCYSDHGISEYSVYYLGSSSKSSVGRDTPRAESESILSALGYGI